MFSRAVVIRFIWPVRLSTCETLGNRTALQLACLLVYFGLFFSWSETLKTHEPQGRRKKERKKRHHSPQALAVGEPRAFFLSRYCRTCMQKTRTSHHRQNNWKGLSLSTCIVTIIVIIVRPRSPPLPNGSFPGSSSCPRLLRSYFFFPSESWPLSAFDFRTLPPPLRSPVCGVGLPPPNRSFLIGANPTAATSYFA